MSLECKKMTVAAALLAPLLLAGLVAVPSDPAMADQCAACYAQENACRQAKQGSASCDAALTRCLQACRKQR